MHVYDIPGWMTEYDLRILIMIAKHVPKNGSILEIGCFFGRSTTALYDGKDSSVSLEVIDPFEDMRTWTTFIDIPTFEKSSCKGNDRIYKVAIHIAQSISWLEAFRYCIGETRFRQVQIFKGTSENHPKVKDYDLVFIDGAHSYEGVKHDIMKYSSDTTLIVGDDFINTHPGVSQAINELREYRSLIGFGESKIWALIPRSGYWYDLFKKNNLFSA
jgi:precorrin-6B methylase 2